ncbi:MAG TPA: tetratricopeptide repeat protein [Paludibacteraceae bacterium]|nr:tetratricopeptide repeat protein [Paludibacteraceae bacterium]HQB69411.1 tetratricopeptide repeat protein [Paludibacteraceae bacterium]HRS67449.1 tetratricopeptide repeat protein [Paludibacteraceae bacterium]
MSEKEIFSIYTHILQLLKQRRLADVFNKLQPLLDELQDWNYINRKEELETVYRNLLQYAVLGVNDPQQQLIFNQLLENLYDLVSDVKEALLIRISSRVEYAQKRYVQITPVRFEELVNALELGASHHALGELLTTGLQDDGEKATQFAIEHEQHLLAIFNFIWLSGKWSTNEKQLIIKLLQSSEIDTTDRSVIISAITLSLLRNFYPSKFTLLLTYAEHTELEVKQRVIVGIALIIARYAERIQLNESCMNQLKLLCDKKAFQQELESIVMQLVRTSETESITKRIREEIMPDVIRLTPMMKDKMDSDSFKMDELNDKNPEWQELLEESGIADKLHEFGELQMDGADVYVSTFAALKSFPFFQNTMNWLLPFDPKHSTIRTLFENKKSLFAAMMRSPFLCNSDKYSFCLSLKQMPLAQQNMMTSNFNAESEQVEEMIKEETLTQPDTRAKTVANQYIQDLYRLYTLHSRKHELTNPLQEVLSIYKTPLFTLLFPTNESRQQLAEFYFSKDLYVEALEQFEILQKDVHTAEHFQKIGYCHQQLNQILPAIETYEQADLLQPQNRWTMRRLAYCFKRVGNYEKALMYYDQCAKLAPENRQILLQIGHCQIELKRYDEAIATYFKADYLSPDDLKIQRIIAWSYLLAGKITEACNYYEKLIATSTESIDYLNAGHAHWVAGDTEKALSLYRKSAENSPSKNHFLTAFFNDKKHLLSFGILEEDFSLWYDALHYQL